MDNLQSMQYHFERVASVYSHVRDTDPDVIKTIIPCLPDDNRPVHVADVGCGTGRYSKIIVAQCDSDLRLLCCDYCSAMLTKCRERMRQEFSSRHIHFYRLNANELPFADGCLDAIVTFNAIHHFDLERFVAIAARVLRPGGLLAIYTRTPEQNARTVWGQYFPEFTERETRLYQGQHLEEVIGNTPELELVSMQIFKHMRAEPLEALLNRVHNLHYSTFEFYSPDEFGQAIAAFVERLTNFSNNDTIQHTAENTLALARRVDKY